MNKNFDETPSLKLIEAIFPVFVLMALLAYNVVFANGILFGDYSNQLILIIAASCGILIGYLKKVLFLKIIKEIFENVKSVSIPILILLLVGALTGTWLVSGVIPAMVYYGLQLLNPTIFLPTSVIISAIISIATGSSWTTSATVGIALVGIGTTLGIEPGMVAGAVISGAYFGDKMSPMSDTTNLAPAMAGTDLFTHIKYMMYTTIPTLIITLVIFTLISCSIPVQGNSDISELLKVMDHTFNISLWLFLVPITVVMLILLKVKPLISLLSGVFMAIIFALIFQEDLLMNLSDNIYGTIVKAVFIDVSIVTKNETLNGLFSSSGMNGMIWTILLIVSAMVFGGVMEGIGALSKITKILLKLTNTTFGLFASTVASCLGLNLIASDQYLAIVIPGKMYKKAFEDKKLAPENLSRTLEDSGTVTSVLIPWNTCGAYQSSVLGVSVTDYFFFAIFNYLSPIITLIYAAFNLKIKQLTQ